MARENQSLFTFNRGVVSRLGLARIDVKRLALAAQVQTNWMPRVLGPMSLRAGLGYLGASYLNRAARYLRFVFATSDTALVELTDSLLRVWINDTLLTRPSVTTAITNGTFAGSLAGWTDLDEAGATSSYSSGMLLVGDGTARAIREQQVTVVAPNTNVEHGIRVVVSQGDVYVRIGSTSGGDEYLTEAKLGRGTHSLSITPTGDFYIRFFSATLTNAVVTNCTIEAAGVVTITAPWSAAQLSSVRYDQSGDIVYVACKGVQQYKIERRGTRPNARSWSVVRYYAPDGPFKVQNTGPITLTPSAINGEITLTASKPFFRSSHVDCLFSITSTGQVVTATSSASLGKTNAIRVSGVGTDRTFSIYISGDASASTVDLQRSFDNSTWSNVSGQQWTADVSTTYDDGLANQIVYYRLILTTRVAPDSVTMSLRIGSGSVRGIARVSGYTSSTVVNASVLTDFGGTDASSVWQQGVWSTLDGWPNAVALHEGRLWWAGQNGVQGSVSDAFDSFDETYVGDAGPINRTIGSGPVDTINWITSLKGMVIGAEGAEYSARASSLDEPLTPTNFNMKSSSTQGSGAVDGIKIDGAGYFVDRSACRVFKLAFDLRAYDYFASNLMELAPEIGYPGIVRMAVQRKPDTRLHCVLSDGTVVVAVLNDTEDVLALVPVTTDGSVEDVVILPAQSGTLDDQVYYLVNRTINGSTVRYLEKWAQEIDCRGDQQLCKLADSHITYTGAATATISAPHLANTEVVVWADGEDVGTDDSSETWTQRYTLDGSGNATLPTPVTNYVVGLGYNAQFQSAKLGTQSGISPLNQQKRIRHIGLILADTHPRGLRFGPAFDYLDDMPLIEDGTEIGTATETDYDQNMIEFPGTWTTDARICLQAQAPRPCTVVAATIDMDRNS